MHSPTRRLLADAGVVYNPPMGMLQDRKILITGVLNRRSIAYAIAQAAAREGASLAFTYQTGDKLRDKVSAIANEDFKGAPVFPCDAAQDDEIAQVFESLKKEWGTLDGFVHSIAFAGRESLVGDYHQTTTRAAFAQANDVSVYSLAAFARAAEPMLSADFAAVTLSYLGAIRAVPNYNLMGVAKAGLEASVRYLALGLGRRGARINAISAGPVRTLAAAGIAGFGKILSAVESAAPLRRNVRTEEIGNAAAFLLSPLSSGITGEIVYVDCGFHLTVGFPLAESTPAE